MHFSTTYFLHDYLQQTANFLFTENNLQYLHAAYRTLFDEQILTAHQVHNQSVLGFGERKHKVATFQIGSDLITKFNPWPTR